MKISQRIAGTLLAGVLLGVTGCGTADDAPGTEQGTPAGPTAQVEESTGTPAEQATSSQEPDAAAEDVTITVTDFEYEISGPVAPGAEITVINNDSAPHTVTSEEDGLFDSEFGPNETVTFIAPDEPGEYPFICTYHPAMVGTLTVEE